MKENMFYRNGVPLNSNKWQWQANNGEGKGVIKTGNEVLIPVVHTEIPRTREN